MVIDEGSSCRLFETSPQPSSAVWFYRGLLSVVGASFLAFVAMYLVRQIPAVDPADVVGKSLIVGYDTYSERAESRAYFAAIITALISAAIFNRLLNNCPDSWILRCGRVCSWFLLPLFAWVMGYRKIPLLLLIVGGCSISGRWISRWRMNAPGRSLPAWMISIIVWGILHLLRTDRFGISPLFFGAILFPAIGILIGLRWLELPRATFPWHWFAPLTALALIYADISAPTGSTEIGWMLTCSVSFLGASVEKQRLWWTSQFKYFPWISATFICLWLGYLSVQFTWAEIILRYQELVLLSIDGLILGILLTIGFNEGWTVPICVSNEKLLHLDHQVVLLPLLIGIWGSTRGLWFGTCLGLTAALVIWSRRRQATSTYASFIAALGIACACQPGLRLDGYILDRFHHGQILSAVWEFEQGASLYDAVFPLRSTEFFLAWISRKVLPHTLIAAHIPLQFGPAFLVMGSCLVTFAWTRSLVWSLAISMACLNGWVTGVNGWEGGRDWILLICMGLACEILRRRHLWLLTVLSLPTFFAGYDIFVPFLGGTIAACAIAKTDPTQIPQTLLRGIIAAGAISGAAVLLFSGILSLWQGTPSMLTFWQLLFDFAAHMTAFYGLPLDEEPHAYFGYCKALAVLTVFAAMGIVCWQLSRPRHRTLWSFLLAAVALYELRGLGRHGFGNFVGGYTLITLLLGLVLHDTLRWAVRSRLLVTRETIPCAGFAFLVLLVPFHLVPESCAAQIWSQLKQIPSEEKVVMPADPLLNQLVAPHEYLWAIDCGIANYVQQRKNPTRHALAYCIGSPAEERKAVNDLIRNPPKVILWDWSPVDGVDGLTRHYLIANHVLHFYRPGGILPKPYELPYAIPAEPGYAGTDFIPAEFSRPQLLGHLPYEWGRLRWPRLVPKIVNESTLSNWKAIGNDNQELPSSGWASDVDLIPRDWNYLKIELSLPPESGKQRVWRDVTLEFSPNDQWDTFSKTVWACPTDGKLHTYLVPISCHPHWTWRTRLCHLRLSVQTAIWPTPPVVNLYDIDELDSKPRK